MHPKVMNLQAVIENFVPISHCMSYNPVLYFNTTSYLLLLQVTRLHGVKGNYMVTYEVVLALLFTSFSYI